MNTSSHFHDILLRVHSAQALHVSLNEHRFLGMYTEDAVDDLGREGLVRDESPTYHRMLNHNVWQAYVRARPR